MKNRTGLCLIAIGLALAALALPFKVNAAPGDLYVAVGSGNNGGTIIKFTPDGKSTVVASGFNPLSGLAFDRVGNLFATEDPKILKFTADGAQTTFVSGLNTPRELVFDRAGNLFVTQSYGDFGGITKVTTTGLKSSFASGGNFYGLAFDVLGNLFASEVVQSLGPNFVTKFTPAGKRSTFAQSYSAGLALSSSGDLFAADLPDNEIDKFTPTGSKSVFAAHVSGGPFALAFDQAGSLFVATVDAGKILKFTPSGATTTFASGLDTPVALAFEPVLEKLRNISARGTVETGGGALIGGFIVGGNAVATNAVVIRAIGPSLAKAGVGNALQDPVLELHDASGTALATNDNWQDSQKAQISATGLAPSDPHESAILASLPAGSYTAVVHGVGNTTGIALVEIYSLSQ